MGSGPVVPPPPPGFVLDAKPSGGLPPPPPGFVLDSAPSPSEGGGMSDQMLIVGNNIAQGAIGLAKSVPQTALGLGQAIRRLVGAQGGTEGVAQELAGASNPQQQNGVDIGKFLQYLIPAAATGGGSFGAQMLGQGAAAGALGAGQSGKLGSEAATTAAAGAAGPLVGKAIEGAASLAPRIVNSLVKPISSAFEFGKNPGRGIVREGIVASSLDDLGQQVAAKSDQLGQQVDAMLKGVKGKVDISSAFQPVDDAIAKAAQRGESPLWDRLKQLKDQLTQDFAEQGGKLVAMGPKATDLTPLEANEFKRQVGELVRWRQGDQFADDVNKVGKQVWSNISKLIEQKVPGVKALNSRWADLITADKAIARRAIVEQRHDLTGVPDIVGGGMGGAIGMLGAGLPGAGAGAVAGGLLKRAAGTTLGKTAGAQAMAGLDNPALIALLRALLPGLASAGATSQGQTEGTQ